MVLQLDKNILMVAFVFYFCIFIPFVMNCIILLYHNRNELFMQKRHISLLLCSIVCCIMLTTRSIILDPDACLLPQICGPNKISSQVSFIIEQCILIPLLISFTSRVYFLFYGKQATIRFIVVESDGVT
eukprot:539851_1